MDQPSVSQVWTFLISESCLYILAEHCASLFQPQYVDGLLNPSHKTFSFTTIDKLEDYLEEVGCVDMILLGIFIVLVLYADNIVLMERFPYDPEKQL